MPRTLRLPLIAALAVLPMLAACGKEETPAPPPPPSDASQAAIRDPAGAPPVELAYAVDGLFDTGSVGTTQAWLVMKGGEVVLERYGHGASETTPLPGWSAGQCVTALVAAQLVSDGRLRPDESAPVPGWSRNGDPRGEITLRQLLQMRSGLRHSEWPGEADAGPTDRERMLFLDGRDDMAAYAEVQPLAAPPGREFAFSAATGVILADIAAGALTPDAGPAARRAEVDRFVRSRLFAPLGMERARVAYDRAGTMIASSFTYAPARDWAMLGEFVRHKGSVRGAQIVPRRWMEAMLRPSPRNPAYGTGVWLKGEGTAPEQGGLALPASAPRDAFGCLGEYGQYVIGSPHQLLTVVRLGATGEAQADELRERLGKLMALYPSNPF